LVTEAAGNNPGTPTATGALTVSDPDAMQSAFNTLSNTPTNYGNFTLDSAGNWTYTLNNSNPKVDALNNGQQLHDQFNVSSVDGTTHKVDIAINGATDSTDLGGPTGITFNLAPTSGNGLTALGAFTATGDPDVGDTFTWSVGAGSSGGFVVSGGVVNASGVAPGDATLNLVVTDQGLNTFSQTYHVWIGSSSDQTKTFTMGSTNNIGDGLGGIDTLTGGNGTDYLVGGTADDNLQGNGGADQLVGGNGHDTFVYAATSDSTHAAFDTILDFTLNGGNSDLIDLTGLGSAPLTFDAAAISGNATVATHHIAWEPSGGNTILYVNTSGSPETANVNTDMEIHLTGITSIASGDILHH